MSAKQEHRVELATYSAILVVTSCPKSRPHVSLTRARECCDSLMDRTPLCIVPEIDGIAVFVVFNQVAGIVTLDDGIRRSKSKGRSLFLQVVLPIWCLNETTDQEFDEAVEAAIVYGLVLAARRFKIDVRPFWAQYEKVIVSSRIKEVFAPLP